MNRQRTRSHRLRLAVAALLCALMLLPALAGCSTSAGGATSGPAFTPSFATAKYHKDKALFANGCSIDTSAASKGYVAATGTSSSRLKLLISCNGMSYNYDMPGDGSPVIAPLNMGDGSYSVSVMKNTSGNAYIALCQTSVWAGMDDEFQPFIRPSQICSYTKKSDCVQKASELVKDAQNQGDAVDAVYGYVVSSIRYDNDKAAKLRNVKGYLSDPDDTLATGTGICIDYSVLVAAMLRSQGIPCKIITGYVSPGDIYHAWNMIYIDGTWQTATIDMKSKTWTRVDTTFDAGGSPAQDGEELKYEDKYVY